jgi:predicted dienelactone hydrolase
MFSHLKLFAAPALALLMTTSIHNIANAAEVGWRQITVAGGQREAAPTVVALFYPTSSAARKVPMGPFSINAAIQAPPEAQVKGLIVLSHGTAGSELGHSSLAQALAKSGYLVAALRHPGDNWQDTSLREGTGSLGKNYFVQRPLQVSQVIDALLQDPLWKDRIASDSKGPRIGAVGHSAGGYTVLALAGGQTDMDRLRSHCTSERADDPIFCSLSHAPSAGAADATTATLPSVTDARVRAVVAMSPASAMFTAASLARIGVPTLLYRAEDDHFVVPRFHIGWVAQNMPQAQLVSVPLARHFAFMDTPNMPLMSPDGDVGANAPDFDRSAFLEKLGRELPAFFDRAW